MRLISLLPAATEWLAAFGLADQIIARSHACDFPATLQNRPVLTRPTSAMADDAAAVDAAVRQQLQSGLSVFDVDLERIRALRPDLIVTQAQCEVCAVSLVQLETLLAKETDEPPRLFDFHPMTFKQVLDQALKLARETGAMPQAMRFVGEQETRLAKLRHRLGLRRDGTLADGPTPTVACIEWIEPLMTAGHWTPDLVEHAGGRAVLAAPGTRSEYISWETLRDADPDVLAILPCGFSIEQTRRNLHHLTSRSGWPDLRAVRTGRVYLFDGNAYFNRPGPRLYRAIELLAHALHPARAAVPMPQAWEMARWDPSTERAVPATHFTNPG